MIIISPHLKLCGTGQFYICSHSRIKARSATLDQYWHPISIWGIWSRGFNVQWLKHYLSLFVAQIKAESCCSDFPFSKAKEEVTEVRCFFFGWESKMCDFDTRSLALRATSPPQRSAMASFNMFATPQWELHLRSVRLKNTLTYIYNFQIWGLKVFTSSREALPSLNIQIHTLCIFSPGTSFQIFS